MKSYTINQNPPLKPLILIVLIISATYAAMSYLPQQEPDIQEPEPNQTTNETVEPRDINFRNCIDINRIRPESIPERFVRYNRTHYCQQINA